MNLNLRARDVLTGISPKLVDELDYVLNRINFIWSKGHDQQTGEHRNLVFDSATVTTVSVGPAGGASALPAAPEGYLVVTVNSTKFLLPFYRVT